MTTETNDEAQPPIEFWDIDRLVPYEKNAKKHPEEQVERLARSIARVGLANPINVRPNGEIITGHGRRLALLKLTRTRVAVRVWHDLDDAEAEAMRIADNTTVSNEWEKDLLQESIQSLGDLGFDLDALGMSEKDLTFAIGEELGDLNEDVFVEDVTEAVEEQKTNNKKAEAEADAGAAPIGDALGFKRVTVGQSREIRGYLGKMETAYGVKGADALLKALAIATDGA